MGDKDLIANLKNQTGCSLMDCKKALILCDNNIDIAYVYLMLKFSGVKRYKVVDGIKKSWTDTDYLQKAKKQMIKER